MTTIYFVRHAQPDHDWEDDRTRPLNEEGMMDSEKVYEALAEIKSLQEKYRYRKALCGKP